MFNLSLANFQHSLFAAIIFCLFMLACHIFANNQAAKEVLDANEARKNEIDSLHVANHKILNSGKGKLGEDAVHSAVLSIFQSLNIQCVTNRQLDCPQAILLPTGDDKYSKEIDLLVASEIGVFVIEVKDWRGLWAAKDDQPHLLSKVSSKSSHRSSQHPSNDRPAPLFKTQNKLKDLLNRANLTDLHAEALVVFTDSEGNVHAQLPPNYLHISELAYYFRQKASAFFGAIDNEGEDGYDAYDLAEQIRPCLDSSPNALHKHMMRLSPSSESLQAYQSNHRRLIELEAMAVLVHQSDRPFGYWVSSMLFFMSLAAMSQALS
jgi:Nuclease-related domain